MSEELRAAAGRLRRLRTENLSNVYQETEDGPSDHLQEMLDRELLSEHCLDLLAENPADDTETVTSGWLRTLPGFADSFGGWPRIGPVEWDESRMSAMVYSTAGSWLLRTRGQVRRLLAALGLGAVQ